ncbi:MAG: S8 family serine peptidase [Pirellulales bacterium]|nr:S8 family serine peptidase [Pirellulales bacterium]
MRRRCARRVDGLVAACAFAVLIIGSAARAETIDPDTVFDAVVHIGSSSPGTFTGSDIGDLIGADTFYNAGYTGASTTVANIEAGHVWSGHETLGHVTSTFAGTGSCDEVDQHATWVGHAIGGRSNAGGTPDFVENGIAYGTDLRSGAIATSWSSALSFSISATSFYETYASNGTTGFGDVDVINSSWGGTGATGTDYFSAQIDGLQAENPETTAVFSAGNSGSFTNSVGGPGSGYNTITVGALRSNSNTYNRVASFSSRGPQNYQGNDAVIVSGVRAAVDITAPGDDLTLAFYGGTTGGNGGGSASGTPSSYSASVDGTSFAAPITAGMIALAKDAANGLLSGSQQTNAKDTRVVKATLLNSADKVLNRSGGAWNNGQSDVGGVITTTQSLDWQSGAGRVNGDQFFDQLFSGETDIAGTSGGISNEAIGWDFATVNGTVGSTVDVVLPFNFEGGTDFAATLTWFRDVESNSVVDFDDNAFADLDLEIWDSTFSTLIAESISDYNSVEHLFFTLDSDTTLGLRVELDEYRFGSQTDISFGLAWAGTAAETETDNDPVPEPTTFTLAVFGLIGLCASRRRRR